MKRKLLIFSTALAVMAAISIKSTVDNSFVHANAAGAPIGHSGAPGELNCTSCHIGAAAATVPNWINSNIPAGGYVPGETYSILVSATDPSTNRFGFQLTAKSSSGAEGTMVLTHARAKLIGNGKYATHTSAGLTGMNNANLWNIDWIAPAAGSGTVDFYAAFNAANGDNGTGGDKIYLSSLTVEEDSSPGVGVENLNLAENSFRIFPSLVTTQFTVEFNLMTESVVGFKVVDFSGKEIKSDNLGHRSPGKGNLNIDCSDLTPGLYFLVMNNDNQQSVQKFVKK
ncbi:MAG: T9SS type A sorting domain-containing protein [Bacteroidetes bacterium]|nr:T9SS type A sorting domain-containing protein [Bacteroidota bacterium]